MTTQEKRNLIKGLIFISPWIAGFLGFMLYPVVASFYYSLCEYNTLKPALFIGLWNYIDLLTDDIFWKSLWNTVYFALFALPLGQVVAIALAVLLNQRCVGRPIFRAIYFLPSLVPLVALAVIWLWIFNGEYGVLNHFLGWLRLKGPNWLGSTTWSKPALIIASLWTVGGAMIIYLASLQDVPRDLYESAELDGASGWHKFLYITLPLISPIIYFNVIIGVITTLQIFAVPYVMTGGGPARSTLFYTMYLYNNAFSFLRMGYASAMAWIMFVIILGATVIITRVSKSRVYYAGE
ncbi:sugar ABC transporter permease [Candidatus Sumerlaeota bacterium]|nr:sugar ABC transporter permease [Candidatus Sumerlaeota bacterium]